MQISTSKNSNSTARVSRGAIYALWRHTRFVALSLLQVSVCACNFSVTSTPLPRRLKKQDSGGDSDIQAFHLPVHSYPDSFISSGHVFEAESS